MSIAEKLLDELRQREDLREALAHELLLPVFKDRRLRTAILTALYRDIATKQDIDDLRKEMKSVEDRLRQEMREVEQRLRQEIDKLRKEFNERFSALENRISVLEQRIAKLEDMMNLFVKLFVAFNVPILVGIIGILLKMISP